VLVALWELAWGLCSCLIPLLAIVLLWHFVPQLACSSILLPVLKPAASSSRDP